MIVLRERIYPKEIIIENSKTFYDRSLQVIIKEYCYEGKIPFSIGDLIEIEIGDYIEDGYLDDSDIYDGKIILIKNSKIYLIEYYNDKLYSISENYINMNKVELIDLKNDLGIIIKKEEIV
jgi:hypothetical protein